MKIPHRLYILAFIYFRGYKMTIIKMKSTRGSSSDSIFHYKKNIKSLNENKYDHLFHKYGEEFGIDWLLLKSQVKCESNFNHKLINKSTGGKGLCQLTQQMWDDLVRLAPGRLGRRKIFRPFDPSFSIWAQCLYLEYAFKRIDDYLIDKNFITDWALAAYKMGILKVLGGRNKSGRYIKGMFEELGNKPIEDAWMNFGMEVFEYVCDVMDTRTAYQK
jgi:hypothetical protein